MSGIWGPAGTPVVMPDVTERTMPLAVETAVAAFGSQPAVRDRQHSYTYEQLYGRSLRLAGGLSECGLGKTDAVLSMLDNHTDHVQLWLALGLSGMVSIPVNTALVGQGLLHILNDSEAAVLVLEAAYLPVLAEVSDRLAHLRTVVVRGAAETPALDGLRLVPWDELVAAEPAAPATVDPWDVHSVMYTSGSTGGPKGVVISHAQTYTRAAVFNQTVDDVPGVSMVTLPLFHVAGQCRGFYGPLMGGLETVVLPRFSVRSFWPDVRHYGVTSTVLLGTMATFLYKQPVSDDDRDHPLRMAIMAPVIDDSAGFADRFGVQVISSYGSTEAGTVSTGASTVPGTLGWMHPEFEARVVDENDLPVPPGRAGELVLRHRSPWTMTSGYWRRPEATVQLWRNLWLHTGDLVRQEPDGELVFVGRSKDVIRRRGENVSPSDVEAAAAEHPAVHDSVAVGVPSEHSEEDIKLAVVVKPGHRLTADELYDHLSARLATFMRPRYIEFHDVIPRTASQKVDKPYLRAHTAAQCWDYGQAGR